MGKGLDFGLVEVGSGNITPSYVFRYYYESGKIFLINLRTKGKSEIKVDSISILP